jgi:serine protease inhibitor
LVSDRQIVFCLLQQIMNPAVTTAGTEFALKFYNVLAGEDQSKNIVMSPFSISVALAMTYVGCRGNTAAQLARGLSINEIASEEVHGTNAQILSALNSASKNKLVLKIANRLFSDNAYTLLSNFTEDVTRYYNTQASSVNFHENPSEACDIINKWVSESTLGKIVNLFPPNSITSLTRVVLVNAVYFKGDWQDKFDEKNTAKGQFHLDANSTVDVQLMYLKKKFNYGYCPEVGDCQVVELPYIGNEVSMFILLPAKVDGLKQLEEALKPSHLIDIEKTFGLSSRDTEVFLPRFKLGYEKSLEAALRELGIHDMFTDAADLSGMDGTKELSVSSVMHKAVIEVNEEGSEAAAATGVAINARCLPRVMTLRADHPFIFLLRENTTKTILFMGRVANPSQS